MTQRLSWLTFYLYIQEREEGDKTKAGSRGKTSSKEDKLGPDALWSPLSTLMNVCVGKRLPG